MDSGAYAACAGLMARSQQLELAAQDLANLNTSGYRSQQTSFRTVLARSGNTLAGSWTNALNGFGILGDTRVTRNAGNLSTTGNPLDLGLEGDGYFALQTPAGVRYTRNGQFRVSPAGVLMNESGDAVLGTQGPITLPQGPVSISGDGTISVSGALAGKLRLAQFAPDVALKAEGASAYVAPVGTEQSATSTYVRQGMLESSNVNPVASAVQLVALQRTAQMLQRALSTFHSDFDRIAVEELPKV